MNPIPERTKSARFPRTLEEYLRDETEDGNTEFTLKVSFSKEGTALLSLYPAVTLTDDSLKRGPELLMRMNKNNLTTVSYKHLGEEPFPSKK